MLTKHVPRTVLDRLSESLEHWFLDEEDVAAHDYLHVHEGHRHRTKDTRTGNFCDEEDVDELEDKGAHFTMALFRCSVKNY